MIKRNAPDSTFLAWHTSRAWVIMWHTIEANTVLLCTSRRHVTLFSLHYILSQVGINSQAPTVIPGVDLADVERTARAAVHRRDDDGAAAVGHQQRQATGNYLRKVWYFLLSSFGLQLLGAFLPYRIGC